MMITKTLNTATVSALSVVRRYRLHWRVIDFLLFMMVLGPLIAPYFAQIDNPLFQGVAQFVFAIGRFICPQPELAFSYGGLPFAVCYRCTAALCGLIVARWLHRPGGAIRQWSMAGRFGFLALTVLWLVIDVQYTHHGLWDANIPLMVGHGIFYGMSVGCVCFAGLVAIDRWLYKEDPAVKPQPADLTSQHAHEGSSG